MKDLSLLKKTAISLSAVAVSGLILAGCLPQPTPSESTTPTSTPLMEATQPAGSEDAEVMGPAGELPQNEKKMPASDGTETGSAATGEVRTIEVEAGSFYYKPNTITVKKGEKVKIVMKSVSMMHDFVIDDLNVKLPVTQAGSTGTVEFTADKVGTFEYYCSVGQHRANGQVGTLVVTE